MLKIFIPLIYFVQTIFGATFIVNGNDAESSPYHVNLLMRRDGVPDIFFGSGALISNRWIVTVAINVHQFNEWQIGIGSKELNNLKYFPGDKGIVHPEFNEEIWNNNIGLVRSRDLIIMNENIQPVTLPEPGILEPLPYENDPLKVTGFGHKNEIGDQPTHLQQSFQRAVSVQECLDNYGFLETLISNFYCAIDRSTSSHICREFDKL